MAKRRRRKHRRGGISPAAIIVPAAAVAAIAIVLIAAAAIRGCGAREAAAVPEGTSEMAGGAAEETADAPLEETRMAETETAAGESEGTAKPETVVAAEVGSMEDDQDPQSSTNTAGNGETGASVDLSRVSVPEGETTEATLGIDVSKYQGTIDWAKVKEAGVDFAMIRVGYRTKVTGVIYEDPGARYNLQEATRNGIQAGAYFFSSAVNEQEAAEEAAWVSDFIARYRITYPVAYNCEDFQSPDSRQYGLTKEERTSIACAFLDTVAAAGYTPMFYASRNEMEGSAQWGMETLEPKYNMNEINEKANYCLSCKTKMCMKGCPLENDITEFIKKVKEKEYEEAYRVLCKTTVLQPICGRVCPHKSQCEGACVRGIKGDPVSIGELEAYTAFDILFQNRVSNTF